MYEKEGEKIEKYQDLKREIGRLWGIRHLEVVPEVLGALGVVSNRLDAWLNNNNNRVYEKEGEKIEKYQDLKREIGRLWGIWHLEVVPEVVGALGVVSNRLDAWLNNNNNNRVYEKEGEKIEKYQDLKREIGRLWGIRHLEVVPEVVGALGVVSNRLDAWLEKLGVTIRTGLLQKTALLGTARIPRKLLESWRRRNDTKDLWPMAMARSFGVMSA